MTIFYAYYCLHICRKDLIVVTIYLESKSVAASHLGLSRLAAVLRLGVVSAASLTVDSGEGLQLKPSWTVKILG